ncbi:PAS domain S-box protein [Geomonas anaerohicana]|uniref:histidine kinase n=1 Tax=Geomonas anaerohicana TaxID=2798583 RepID=A0ABS0YJN7_9BACT|nr:PAS domain S-box protein [Geomonas anaerohicana]MBJ6752495.1 PAS domain S-box protein [Geomonas anaerohicana]
MIVADGKVVEFCESVRDACCSVDMDGNILHANEAFCCLVGYDRTTLRTKTSRDITPHEYLPCEAELIENQVKVRGFSEIYEKEYVRQDGTRVPVELMRTLMTDADGAPGGMLAIVRDISARKQLQQELVRSREEYRALADNSPDIMIRFDRNLYHVYANAAAAKACGIAVEELVGRTLFEIGLPPELEETWKERIWSVFNSGTPMVVEDCMPFESGIRHFEYQLVPEGARGEKALTMMVVGRDITERKRVEGALLEVQEELERRVAQRTESLETALREQEAFSYSVSHDLRAPLRHINAYLRILTEDFESQLPPEAVYFIDKARDGSDRMGKLIDDLLELARVGRVALDKAEVDLSELALAAAMSLQEMAPERAATFSIEPGITVSGDKLLLNQLIANLLQNAWKYSAKKETASIGFGRRTTSEGDVLYVEDDGVGFEMAFSDKLFRPFQRLHGPEYEGNGIGLATVERIVDRHGGRIWADSEVGEGTVFYFTLS